MSEVKLSEVEWINLNVLFIIHAGLQNDWASTCCKFALNAEQANYLQGLVNVMIQFVRSLYPCLFCGERGE